MLRTLIRTSALCASIFLSVEVHGQRASERAIDARLIAFLRERYDDHGRPGNHMRLVRDVVTCERNEMGGCRLQDSPRASRLADLAKGERTTVFRSVDSLLVEARRGIDDEEDCSQGRISWLEIENPIISEAAVLLTVAELSVSRAWRCPGGELVRTYRFDLKNGQLKYRSDSIIAHASVLIPPRTPK